MLYRCFYMVSVALLVPLSTAAQDDASCMLCHGDPALVKTLPNGRTASLYVDFEAYETTAHAENGCVSCHFDIAEIPHEAELEAVQCGVCHVEADEAYAQSLHGIALGNGEGEAARCDDCHGVHDILPVENPRSRVNALNQPETCGRCHSDPDLVQRLKISQLPIEGYLHSTHAGLILSGENPDAAACNDCHGTHDLQPAHSSDSKVFWRNVPQTCGACHPDETAAYENSIHGKALRAGIQDAPNCTDCHGEHDIEGPDGENSTVSQAAVTQDTCARCHDDEKIMARYGIALHREGSYMDSFHGTIPGSSGDVAASCVSCHGVHNILPQSDPAATIHPENLPGTCAQCHEGANANFAAGSVHIIPTSPDQRLLGLVRVLYLWLIYLVIGAMLLHNVLKLARHTIRRFTEERRDADTYRRFTTGEVIGHMLLAVSFITLVVSGFALRFPDAWWAKILFYGDSGMALRGTVHRIAGLVLVALAVANAVYVLATKRGRGELVAWLPRIQDLREGGQSLSYFLGMRSAKPAFGRFSYVEKLEYWGMWWGTVLMIITGFCMWYPETSLQYMPKFALDLMDLIHYYEAWLAMLTILVWHMYHVILDPDSYPMNWTWLTGRITNEELREHHPLEYEALKKKVNPQDDK